MKIVNICSEDIVVYLQLTSFILLWRWEFEM